eukprot:15356721-Ditylum_brightwellii.AAC.1
MLLLGSPGYGTYMRRNLVYMYAELTQRQVEVVTLSGDVTESDLKQRRELRVGVGDGHDGNGTAAHVAFMDQPP